jgi:hypothetical protein
MDWQTVVTFLVSTGLLTFLGKIAVTGLEKWRHNRITRQTISTLQGFEENNKVYDYIEAIRSNTPAARVCIMKSHNGGGIPSAINTVHLTMTHEAHNANITPIKPQWQNRTADSYYATGIIRPVISKKEVHIAVADMGGEMKTLYESNNHTNGYIKLLAVGQGCLVYLSISGANSQADWSPADKETVNQNVSKLMVLFESLKSKGELY